MRENIFSIVIEALLAAFGALARQLNTLNKKPLKPVSLISGCFIAMFMGVIFSLLAEHFNVDKNIAYAAAGISGWVGPQILDKIANQVMQMAGIKGIDDVTIPLDDDERENDK